jgi:hypothetical protein
MQSFKTAQSNSQLYCHQPFLLRYVYVTFLYFFFCFWVLLWIKLFILFCLFWWNRGEDINRNQMRFSDLGDFQHSSPFFQQQDAVDLSSSNNLHLFYFYFLFFILVNIIICMFVFCYCWWYINYIWNINFFVSGCMFSNVKSNNVVIGGSNMQYGTTINTVYHLFLVSFFFFFTF